MTGFIDLHCHYLPAIDDGVRSAEDGIAILRGLGALGFARVVATPHMRPGMFDDEKPALEATFAAFQARVAGERDLPEIGLASEHFLDDVVFERLRNGAGLPYPGSKAVLVELPPRAFPLRLAERFSALRRAGLTPVLAHPERYEPVWKDPGVLEELLDVGARLLLDACAIAGKYGAASERAAKELLDMEAYDAACSDAHRPADTEILGKALRALEAHIGKAEVDRLFRTGPAELLAIR